MQQHHISPIQGETQHPKVGERFHPAFSRCGFSPSRIVRGMKGLSASTRTVYATMIDLSQKHGRCWASYAAIAEQSAVTRRTAMNAVSALAKAGLIEVQQRKSSTGDNSTNVYCFLWHEAFIGAVVNAFHHLVKETAPVTSKETSNNTQLYRDSDMQPGLLNANQPAAEPPADPVLTEVHRHMESIFGDTVHVAHAEDAVESAAEVRVSSDTLLASMRAVARRMGPGKQYQCESVAKLKQSIRNELAYRSDSWTRAREQVGSLSLQMVGYGRPMQTEQDDVMEIDDCAWRGQTTDARMLAVA